MQYSISNITRQDANTTRQDANITSKDSQHHKQGQPNMSKLDISSPPHLTSLQGVSRYWLNQAAGASPSSTAVPVHSQTFTVLLHPPQHTS
jgi:hypothetical protein